MGLALAAFMLPIRAIQGLFAMIVLGVLAYAANNWAWWWSPSQINFLIFTAVWTLLALIYLIIAPARYPTAAHKFGILVAEVLTMLFWFAGFIALAVLLTDVGCNGRRGQEEWGPCRAAIAGDVFAAFEWLLFCATTLMAALHCWRTRNERSGKHDPAMEVHTHNTHTHTSHV
ncbi:uncharacterized protein K444DRAFT_520626 [Hyaloscypha bicolor E]|uniref:MARVEL domain-containing protein n=1 Tax=Hyaloscypha bicolor E TaxID=1095630 RepID=A0A2J6TNT5_9HELO|nr:uncharacterized protein K444DRAFT_520626 [Hyaloscypha bicolor E]PMD64608.1 hypothetical protein K444DRAFT_520626 [Hyaloscypha bicolor E]